MGRMHIPAKVLSHRDPTINILSYIALNKPIWLKDYLDNLEYEAQDIITEDFIELHEPNCSEEILKILRAELALQKMGSLFGDGYIARSTVEASATREDSPVIDDTTLEKLSSFLSVAIKILGGDPGPKASLQTSKKLTLQDVDDLFGKDVVDEQSHDG